MLNELDLEFNTEIRYLKLKVKKFDGQDVRVRPIIVCKHEIMNNAERAIGVPKLVFVHGYCGSGALFHKIYEILASNICLILVDLVGMGSSDHPDDFDEKSEDITSAIDYFVDYLELWR